MTTDVDFSDAIEAATRQRETPAPARGNIRVTDGVIPMFYTTEVEDKRASDEAGRPIYRSEDWIEILVPGSRDRVRTPVRKEHRARFPEQWESYKRGDDRDVAGGTPIGEWQGISRTRAAELKAQSFYTVEQLATASDQQIARLGHDARALQKQAQDYIAGREVLESERKLRAEIESQYATAAAELAELRRELAALRDRMNWPDSEAIADGADNTAARSGRRPRDRG
jgi:hypothetical protein